jgi:hypothetical protein
MGDGGDRKAGKGILSTMKKKQIPKFKSEEEEREFWSSHDATDFIDFSGNYLDNVKLT